MFAPRYFPPRYFPPRYFGSGGSTPVVTQTLPEALRAFILADATVAALIGTRMYALILPQNPTMPALTYTIFGAGGILSHDGPSGLENPTVQIDAWGTTYSDAFELAEAVRVRLNGYSGLLDTVHAQGIFLVRKRDSYENESELYRRSTDFELWNEESS